MKRQFFLFLFFILLVCSSVYSQNAQIRFEHLDIRDGLSHNRVNSIYQDQLGFIWFGTRSGLDRYDGTTIKSIEYDEDNPKAPADPYIVWIAEGPEGYLWMKGNYSAHAYDIYTEQFVDISDLVNELQINNYNLSDIVKDEVGNYWFLIEGVGVKKYLWKTRTVYHYGGAYRDVISLQPDNQGNMAIVHRNGEVELVNTKDSRQSLFITYPDHIRTIQNLSTFIDRDGDYWFYSADHSMGICYYNVDKKQCKHFGEKELTSNLATGIIQDPSGRIIIGADHGGVTIVNKQNWNFQNFSNNPSDPKSLTHNSVISVYRDRSGLVWMGTNKGGVNYFSPKSASFNFYKQTNTKTPNANDIWPIVEDTNGDLWLGTDGGGLVHFNLKTGKFQNYRHDANRPKSISSDIVVSMAKGANGGLWLGTYFGGLNYFDGSTFSSYFHDPNDPNSISDNSVWKLFLDSKDNIWVGTLKGGVDVYTPDFKKIHHFGLENQAIHSNYITSICEDKTGKIWIGTGYGVEVYNPEDKTFRHILEEEGNPNSLTNNSILDIHNDTDNHMWICTMNGLSKYDQSADQFTNYSKKDGLPENIITSALQDDDGNIWLSTYKGISKLTQSDTLPIFQNFDISDGLQGDMFNERSSLKLANGHLAFGGKNGLNVFNPENITVKESHSKMVFLDFYISNQQVQPGKEINGRVLLEKGINKTNSITLKPLENSFTVEFTALNFYHQENMIYRYRLVGFDEEWITRPNIHRANYTNLDPGTYTFDVTATDQNNIWDEQVASMEIEILTPFWKTPLANLIYTALVLVALLLTRRAIIQKERFRAQVDHDQLESKRLHDLDMMKIKFFTNISHEFRTPLTLILTPIERLLKSTDDPVYQKNFQLIFRNAKRLLTLVNQLLDFRKMEANQHRLSLSTGDLVVFCNSIVESFSDLATERHIQLSFQSGLKEFFTFFDRDKMEKIMFNLLSNALKFTPTGGKVLVELSEHRHQEEIHWIRMSVKDTGIGIPAERLNDVFNRFFQVEGDKKVNINYGSGIGLAITKEFVEMHAGNIWVESELEKGSSFYFELPMKRLTDQYESRDIVSEYEGESIEPDVYQESKPSLLLVEDNSDFRFYLKDNLKDQYNIYEASNGKIAWKKIMEKVPDLVITDIMMPELNGIDLCKRIKSDPRSAHLPVILLTAHYSDDQKLDGFEAGAIEYITKPFNFEILVRAIRSAIQLQRLIHESEHRMEVKPSEIKIESLDERFIKRAMDLVEENLSNADFSVQELSREMAVSRGQLYKKTLELTGKTPIEFIRMIRIKRAAALLERSQLNVAEVAYKVGFNNPKYFTKYFKKEYKVLPSKYAEQESREV